MFIDDVCAAKCYACNRGRALLALGLAIPCRFGDFCWTFLLYVPTRFGTQMGFFCKVQDQAFFKQVGFWGRWCYYLNSFKAGKFKQGCYFQTKEVLVRESVISLCLKFLWDQNNIPVWIFPPRDDITIGTTGFLLTSVGFSSNKGAGSWTIL